MKDKAYRFFIVIMVAAILNLLMAILTMLLWNYVMPLFELPEISFWNAVALNFLCHILFKNNPSPDK